MIKREFVENAQALSSESIKVYLVLIDRALSQKVLKIGLSITELARRADLGTHTVKRCLDELTTATLIVMTPKGKNFLIDISPYFVEDEGVSIPFTYTNTDEKKLSTVEGELNRLQREHERGIMQHESGLAAILTEQKRDLVIMIERDLGRALSVEEAFLLGQLLGGFDPTRVKLMWQRKAATAKNPIRALSAMLWNNAAGKPMPQKELISPPKVRKL